MEKMLVVVFDNETKAYEGSRALYQVDSEGSITIHAEAVISKNNDGTITVKQGEGDFPVRTVSGTAIGSLIGLLGGPAGLAVGALAGTMAGSLADLFVAGVGSDFLAEVSNLLTPGKYAIVADISEMGNPGGYQNGSTQWLCLPHGQRELRRSPTGPRSRRAASRD